MEEEEGSGGHERLEKTGETFFHLKFSIAIYQSPLCGCVGVCVCGSKSRLVPLHLCTFPGFHRQVTPTTQRFTC